MKHGSMLITHLQVKLRGTLSAHGPPQTGNAQSVANYLGESTLKFRICGREQIGEAQATRIAFAHGPDFPSFRQRTDVISNHTALRQHETAMHDRAAANWI